VARAAVFSGKKNYFAILIDSSPFPFFIIDGLCTLNMACVLPVTFFLLLFLFFYFNKYIVIFIVVVFLNSDLLILIVFGIIFFFVDVLFPFNLTICF